MNIRRIAALLLGLVVIVISNSLIIIDTPKAIAAPQSETKFTPQQQDIIKQLQTSRVIYLGEIHDRPSDRQNQLSIIKALFAHQPHIAIGMEMFQRPAQPILDRYSSGKITEAQLREQTEFDRRWGYSWEDYAPILRQAKLDKLPIIALNTPTEITRQVARQGLESLTTADLKYIPPITEIDRTNTKYQQLILTSYQQHAQNASITSKNFDRFYTAQLLWDETMADRITNFITTHPNHQIIVLVGQAHILNNYGIPDRVKRRIKTISQKTIQLQPNNNPKSTDFIWNP